eukprot:NODE_295_length_10520_cov_1.134344.p3 type:complete len:372 gc:universal NODE_295_length_10520_cov_1.134344:10024-8909(-)
MNLSYEVTATRANQSLPVIEFKKNSDFEYNYNAAFVTLKDGSEGLIVRCQKATKKWEAEPSVMVLAKFTTKLELTDLDDIQIQNISSSDIIFKPETDNENYGVEDPRIVFNSKDKTYYLTYTAAEQTKHSVTARLAIASTQDVESKKWTRHGVLIDYWSKSGAIIVDEDKGETTHFMIWGDDRLRFSESKDLLKWKIKDEHFLQTRRNYFDSQLVEAGPPPIKMADGNYFFIYNSAQGGFPSDRPNYSSQYNVGFLILDGETPRRISQRSSSPILTPVLDWEVNGYVPNVIFVEGMKRLEPSEDGTEYFLIFYGAGDANIGAAIVTVKPPTMMHEDESVNEPLLRNSADRLRKPKPWDCFTTPFSLCSKKS